MGGGNEVNQIFLLGQSNSVALRMLVSYAGTEGWHFLSAKTADTSLIIAITHP